MENQLQIEINFIIQREILITLLNKNALTEDEYRRTLDTLKNKNHSLLIISNFSK